MNILIVDDEERARSLLKGIIKEYFSPNKSFCATEASNLDEAVALIQAEKPELVFMDIEMPGGQGTDLLNRLPAEDTFFHLVFTTAYQEFALKAFEMNALDYLLKPIRPKKVNEVIKRVEEEQHQESIQEQLDLLRSSLMTRNFKKIGLPLSDGVEFVPIDEIMQMEADGMYTTISLKSGQQKVVSKPLKHFVELLADNKSFLKPHRSHLINMRFLKQYSNRDGGYLVLDNDKIVPIARNRKQDILDSLR